MEEVPKVKEVPMEREVAMMEDVPKVSEVTKMENCDTRYIRSLTHTNTTFLLATDLHTLKCLILALALVLDY